MILYIIWLNYQKRFTWDYIRSPVVSFWPFLRSRIKSNSKKFTLCWGGIVINRAVDIELQEDLRFRDPVNA